VTTLVLLAFAICGVGILIGDSSDLPADSAEWFILAGIVLGGALFVVLRPSAGEGFTTMVAHDYRPTQAGPVTESKVARGWRVAMARYRYHHALGLLSTLGGLATISWALLGGWELMFGDPSPLPTSWKVPVDTLTTMGVAAVTAIAASLFTLGLGTWRNAKLRTTVGILWDLVSFWPRVAHPLCPLPYGGRAVRAVALRASQLAKDGFRKDDQGRLVSYEKIVLSGHSQGAVIAEAACAVLYEEAKKAEGDAWLAQGEAEAALRKISLITYGSQLQFIYARLFPGYFGFALLHKMFKDMLNTRWRSIYRWTDPLGGRSLAGPTLGRAPRGTRRINIGTGLRSSDGPP
jgi:hypothetical protein